MSAGRWQDRFGIGTAQMGLDYGITNLQGQVGDRDARTILGCARALGIEYVDTARAYGDSEATLGRLGVEGFRLVTKIPALPATATCGQKAELVRLSAEESLRNLHVSSVEALLIHQSSDLLGPGGDQVWDALDGLKAEGRTARIGVSVYEAEEIDSILDRYPVDIVQLPINPLDRRLIDGGQLERLRQSGVEVHARSIFLQGLLLADPASYPGWLAPVAEASDALNRRFDALGLSRLEGLIGWALALPVDRLIVGVTRSEELQDIAFAAERSHSRPMDDEFSGLPELDEAYLSPARWDALRDTESRSEGHLQA